MRNRYAVIGLGIVIIGLMIAVLVFTTVNQTPSAGDGATEIDNVSANAREVAPDAVGGEAPVEPALPTPGQ
jgi:hypothetical protein